MAEKRTHPEKKDKIHPRNKHRGRYNFSALVKAYPELKQHIVINKFGDETVNFSNPVAVQVLNAALLKYFYKIDKWDLPEKYLVPPIPGRADYIHHIADLLANSNNGVIPTGKNVRCLDIGVGVNCIYPILGVSEYEWSFVGTDIDKTSLDYAKRNVENNKQLSGNVELRLQYNSGNIFRGVIRKDEKFDITICNPPFHRSQAEANTSAMRKISNLSKSKKVTKVLNFGGQSNELWSKGGEVAFVKKMIAESEQFQHSCLWFSSLISKESSMPQLISALKAVDAKVIKTIPMGQGNKVSRILAWSFVGK